MGTELRGIPAAPGLAKGAVARWDQPTLEIPSFVPLDARAEVQRLARARRSASSELQALAKRTAQQAGRSEAGVFEAQAMFLDDSALVGRAEDLILTGVNAEQAWQQASEHFAVQLEALPDETLRARSADVRDVARRVVENLLGVRSQFRLEAPAVLLARDLAPSQTAGLQRSMVLAFCTAEGGPTSHTAILAKAFGIPAVVGLGAALMEVAEGTPVLVDGTAGEVVVDPAPGALAGFERRMREDDERRAQEAGQAHLPAVTADGHRVEVVANVGGLEDAQAALENGAEGIGLLRTEFLFLNRDTPPDEATQTRAYEALFRVMGERPVVVRTLDIGGDKEVAYYDFGREANPFLGFRAIRISLERPEEFKVQLRALLRAGAGHDLRVMFPMVATLEEARRARALLEGEARGLKAAGEPCAQRFQVGIMVEIPSVALLAEAFASEVEFFSVGTNDLTQYTLAAERGNPRLAALSDACHPAVLLQIARVVEAAHARGKWVGVCGELAGDPQAIPLLVGLGVDELSMASASIPRAKSVVRGLTLPAARALAQRALALESAAAVREAVAAFS